MVDDTPPPKSLLAQWDSILPGVNNRLSSGGVADLDGAAETLQRMYRTALGEMELRAALSSMRDEDIGPLEPYPSLYALTEALSDPAQRPQAEDVLERFLTPPPDRVAHLEYGPDLMAAVAEVQEAAGPRTQQVIAEAKTAAIADFVARIEVDIQADLGEITQIDAPALDS